MKYVRCYYCDISVAIEDVKIDKEKTNGRSHGVWTCPCCDHANSTYIFTEDKCGCGTDCKKKYKIECPYGLKIGKAGGER